MVQEDLVVGLVLVENELCGGFGVLEETVFVQAVLVPQKEETVFGRSVGTPDQALLVLKFEESQHCERGVVLVLEGHVGGVLRLAVFGLVELQIVYDQLLDQPVLTQVLTLF